MNLRHLIFAACSLAALGLAACGGIAVIDGDGVGGSSAMSSSGATDVATTNSTGSGIDTLQLTLIDAFAFADCMPVVAPDPLGLKFSIDATNTSPSSVGLSVTAARMVSPQGQLQFDVNPANLVISGNSSQELVFEKALNSATGDNGCQLCGSTNIRLELDLEVDGAPSSLDGAVNSISCAL